jgi:hypothetical protein
MGKLTKASSALPSVGCEGYDVCVLDMRIYHRRAVYMHRAHMHLTNNLTYSAAICTSLP